MLSVQEIEKAIIANDHKWPFTNGYWLAKTSDGASGIFRFRGGRRIFFHIIRPWAYCPQGDVIVENYFR